MDTNMIPPGHEAVVVERGRSVGVMVATGPGTTETRTALAGETVVVSSEEAADLRAAGFVVDPGNPKTITVAGAQRPNLTGNPAGIGAVTGMQTW